jgi:hypothetical protein
MSKRYRMVAWFGPKAAEPFNMLDEVITSIVTSAQMLVQNVGNGSGSLDRETRNNWEAEIWWGKKRPDTTADRVEEAVQAIEAICRPALEGRKT